MFFFQAEDGIRDHCVTGVQTCALPISGRRTNSRTNLNDSLELHRKRIGRVAIRLARSSTLSARSRRKTKVISELHEVRGLIHGARIVEVKDGTWQTESIAERDEVHGLIHGSAAIGIAEEAEELIRSR